MKNLRLGGRNCLPNPYSNKFLNCFYILEPKK